MPQYYDTGTARADHELVSNFGSNPVGYAQCSGGNAELGFRHAGAAPPFPPAAVSQLGKWFFAAVFPAAAVFPPNWLPVGTP